MGYRMEVLINGQVIRDPKLAESETFPKLMDEINQIVIKREEIIVDVMADGREIPSWDTAHLDVARVDRLEIHSEPAKDFALASLADLGDYTGEVLSVLRNVDRICQKDGFGRVRQMLVDGLEYILTVIEMSSNVLQLKLDQARYDMRTGEQMRQEVISLKSNLAASPDLPSAKKLFEELELTLTDWLKFLEILLQKYSEKQDAIGTSEDIRNKIKTQVESLDRLETDIKSIVDHLYAGRVAKSMDQFQSRILALQDSLSYIHKLKDAGRLQYHQLSAQDESLSDKIPKIANMLKELSNSIQIGDTVLMRDLLEYEVLPFISYLRQIYGKISDQQRA